ncbi:septal ring lytic transglycosylase RlpA family protein [Rhodopila sp.]|uniref:septal ring lytic transglycosylase RlpA family protein n=1 Tax=Rhodopila sp. TaxID=2480087 RepID=UPI003D0A94E8
MNGWRAATAAGRVGAGRVGAGRVGAKWIGAGWICVLLPCAAIAAPLPANAPGAKQEAERLDQLPPLPPAPAGHIDHSGRTESGRASYYAHSFANRKMANGKRMNPNADIAASKTLPLGSVAKVTNLRNGKTATVKIEDRGPYVNGRVVDLAPKVANQLDLTHRGVAPVVVKPVTLPQPDGQVKLGAGAAEATPQEVQQAIEATRQLTSPNETAEK